MAFSQISTSVTIINSGLIGYMGVSLTNYTSTSLSLIASGSGVEVAGAFFKADSDITPNASSWTAITTATTAYLVVVPSGTAGSQILSASWLSTAPVWSSSKQGWYASAASTTRVIASCFKVSSTAQDGKYVFDNNINDLLPSSAGKNGDKPILRTNFTSAVSSGATAVTIAHNISNAMTNKRVEACHFMYYTTTPATYYAVWSGSVNVTITDSNIAVSYATGFPTAGTVYITLEYA